MLVGSHSSSSYYVVFYRCLLAQFWADNSNALCCDIYLYIRVAPHQPRLDWQMWFAALGSYQHNHWFIVMLYRLLENEPTVLSLMQDNPFPHQPPKYIKAQLFTYHFSAISTRR